MTNLEAALEYYDLGWQPLPIMADGSKRPAIARWRQFQFARSERKHVEEWFSTEPLDGVPLNVAVITGRVSGLVVVDFDGEVVDPVAFAREADLPPGTPLCRTGAGFHAYFRHPGGNVQNAVRIGRIRDVPVDVRGDGGYVITAPSIHANGKVYTWLVEPHADMPVLPDSLRRVLERSPDYEQAQTAVETLPRHTDLERLLAGVGQGERNSTAASVAGYFLKVTKDESAAWSAVKLWNRLNTPPLGDSELRTTFTSIARAARENAVDEAVTEGDDYLSSGDVWAERVRFAPPRYGVQAPSLPGLEEVGGVVPKDLVILAGRPGLGKSTAAWGVVCDVALKQKVPTIIFSTEMTSVDVARWMASKMHRTPVGRLTKEQWNTTLDLVAHSPVTICDRGNVTSDYICRVVSRFPLTKLVIVDHIQRVNSGAGENRNRELEAMTARFKSLAKDNNCTVLLLSQLNRQGGGGTSRPNLTALRDSGGLEQEADAVIMVWSECEDMTLNPLPVKFYLVKNRHGALTEIDCDFQKDIHHFRPHDALRQIKQQAVEAGYAHAVNQTVEELSNGNTRTVRHSPDPPCAEDQDDLLRCLR